MRRRSRRALHVLFPFAAIALPAAAQGHLSWEQVLQRFQQNNPALLAGETNVEETRANEISAGLKPNPQLTLTLDQWNLLRTDPFQPFANAQSIVGVTQLIERRRKRPLRMESAQLATSIAGSEQADAQRQLLFTLRDSFVRLLQAKSVLELAQDNLHYYEEVIAVKRRRFEAGDLARDDFDRIALQRAQYESDLQNAEVNLRTAKITLLSDTAYAQTESMRALPHPYRDTYLPQAVRVRNSVSYAYSKGDASLLDFLDAQKSYCDTELSYRNLIGSYLSAVNQLNLAVGREVL
jgi:cobalt-zinc-cadmium efflux system outer membrane protein